MHYELKSPSSLLGILLHPMQRNPPHAQTALPLPGSYNPSASISLHPIAPPVPHAPFHPPLDGDDDFVVPTSRVHPAFVNHLVDKVVEDFVHLLRTHQPYTFDKRFTDADGASSCILCPLLSLEPCITIGAVKAETEREVHLLSHQLHLILPRSNRHEWQTRTLVP